MSDSSHEGSGAGCFLMGAILTIPISIVGKLLLNNYLIDKYGKLANVPAERLESIETLELFLNGILIFGLVIMFPFGLYLLAKHHMGH